MAIQKSLSSRGFVLASILNKPHGSLEMVLKVMDLQDKIEALEAEVFSLQDEKRVSLSAELWPEIQFENPVEIQDIVKEDGETLRFACSEGVWRESLSAATKLDIRAILGEMPKMIGYFPRRVIYQKDGEIRQGEMCFWVVPAKDKQES
jgi:hypothetical protein